MSDSMQELAAYRAFVGRIEALANERPPGSTPNVEIHYELFLLRHELKAIKALDTPDTPDWSATEALKGHM